MLHFFKQLKDISSQMSRLESEIAAARQAVGPAQSQRDMLIAQRESLQQTQVAAEAELEGRIK